MSKLMISSSGLRGIVGEHLSPALIDPFVRSYLKWLPKGPIVIGGDTRTSYDPISQLVASICQLCGRSVICIGWVPTPTVQQMVRKYGAAGGFAITASHNPVEWNGIKIIDASGAFLDKSAFDSFYRLYESKSWVDYVPWDQQGKRQQDVGAIDAHVDIIMQTLPVQNIRPLKVLIDVNHGTGAPADKGLFQRLGMDVDFLFDGAPGEFSHTPEPVAENLTALCETMAQGNYDIGFAQDPDADRLVIVDETGRFIGEDYSLAFSMDYYLSIAKVANPQVVVNLSTSKVIEDIVHRHGGTLHQTKIGEPNVTAKMKAIEATIGGEGNGGIILPSVGWGRDSLTGIVLALLHLSTTGQRVSEIIRRYPTYCMVREKQPLASSTLIQEKVDRVTQFYKHANVNLDDGIKVSFESSWVHIRPSNTEPIIRIFAEAPTLALAEDLVAQVKSL
ncbi:MAG: phosphoglucosamine mutase [Candidatus Marinamargulisbacteria bacterium]